MQHFLGLQGTPRRYYAFTAYDYLKKTRGQNLIISIAAMVLIGGQLLFLVNFVWSLFKGRVAASNPWQATTLEWTVPSPPPHGNFGDDAVVTAGPTSTACRRVDGDFAVADGAGPAGAGDRMSVARRRSYRVDASAKTSCASASGCFSATVTMLFAAFTSAYSCGEAAATGSTSRCRRFSG